MTLALFVGTGAVLYGYQQYNAPGPLAAPALVTVEKGQGVSAITRQLAEKNIIANPLLFRIAARLTEKHTALKAGEYSFPAGVSLKTVLEMLESGAVYQRQFTVPEGLTSWQVVQLLNGNDALEGTIKEIPAEGSLLPETYNFVYGASRQEKIAQMQAAMTRTLDELWEKKGDNAPLLSRAEVVILASIVEKETAVPEERRRVAGVFVNRLKKGMKLQTDPTVIYALTEGRIQDNGKGPLGRRLLIKDLQAESPYNTYKYPGLPPGPIANPGRASLAAVLNPEKHDYLYFVASGDGGHAFAKTLAEHNANVAKWRKIRRERGN